jgi:hypothetical protein
MGIFDWLFGKKKIEKKSEEKSKFNFFEHLPTLPVSKTNSKIETTAKSTEQSKKRLTYLLPLEDKPGVYLEIDSIAKILRFGDYFFSLSDWEQIKGIIESFKKVSNDDKERAGTMFSTWLINEFRYMEYSFDDKFKFKFAKKIMSYYADGLTISELEEYFNNNVPWKK